MLASLSIKDYASRLASKQATPGGGSASALTGLLGVSLIEMTLNLTINKAQYSAHLEFLTAKQAALIRLHNQLEELIDKDAQAFGEVMAAYKLPKESDSDKATRSAAIQASLQQAAEVPLAIARVSLEGMEIAKALLGKVYEQAISDLAVGSLQCHAAIMGALLNTAINLPLIKDQSLTSALEGQIHLIRTEADGLLVYLQQEIYGESTFAVMRAE